MQFLKIGITFLLGVSISKFLRGVFMSKFICFIFCLFCFVKCSLSKNSDFKNKDSLFQGVKNVENINSESDWKNSLGLSNKEFDTLIFFVNALKCELTKGDKEFPHFDIVLNRDASKIENYIKKFLLKLQGLGKVKELLSYIQYGRDNPPNEVTDEKPEIDAKDFYKLESRLAYVFDNYFMLLNSPTSKVNNNDEPNSINSDSEIKILEQIKKVSYEFRSSTLQQ
ncbi:hypothetical protein CV673_06785 [Borreliella burgdorferi]|nr:hypothetical protein CV670_06665 [Borreliella burgdorferi]PRR43025.1 hypothetical protein CV673_06785 [Borreliella burgdorferi]